MKINTSNLFELALSQIDNAGVVLDRVGVDNNINRHTILAFAHNQQQRVNGHRDMVKARVGSNLSRARNEINHLTELGLARHENIRRMASEEMARLNLDGLRERISAPVHAVTSRLHLGR
jgi:hypothetical protein